jgi:hypothetical protein
VATESAKLKSKYHDGSTPRAKLTGGVLQLLDVEQVGAVVRGHGPVVVLARTVHALLVDEIQTTETHEISYANQIRRTRGTATLACGPYAF